jgi:hypothetical protein
MTYDTLKAMVGLRIWTEREEREASKVIDFNWPDRNLVILKPSGRIIHGISADSIRIHKEDQEEFLQRLEKRHGVSSNKKSESPTARRWNYDCSWRG